MRQTALASSEPAIWDRWSKLLAGAPLWTPREGPLVVVSPHPDDEVLGAGGLIHSWCTAGRPVTVVSVTDGEAASPRARGLDLVRRGELIGALRTLCPTHVSVLRIGLPDGRVAAHANRLRNALLALLESDVTLVAPYERDGHPDHDAAGAVCCGLARTHGARVARYPIWTWQHAEPQSLKGVRWGKFPLSLDARRAKARAVRCFASQLQSSHGAPVVPARALPYFERPYEAFVI